MARLCVIDVRGSVNRVGLRYLKLSLLIKIKESLRVGVYLR